MRLFNAMLAATSLVLAASALAQSPDPRSVYINSLTFGGTGCPAGTVAGNISEDLHAFTLLYDSFVTEAGPGIPLSSSRKACQAIIDIHIPQGWQMTLFSLDTRGYLGLDDSASAVIQTKYYFQGSLSGPTLADSYFGPYYEDYIKHDEVLVSSLVWSPCGVNRALNVNTSARVSAFAGGQALATVDSSDGEFRQLWGIRWRRC